MYLRQAGLTCSSKFVISIPFVVGDKAWLRKRTTAETQTLAASAKKDLTKE
jgi:hypothetical protein